MKDDNADKAIDAAIARRTATEARAAWDVADNTAEKAIAVQKAALEVLLAANANLAKTTNNA